MQVTPHCLSSLYDLAQQLWTFVNSKEGQLLLWLILASHTFARSVRDTGTPEAAEFSGAVLIAVLLFLLALATETGFAHLLMSHVQKCSISGDEIALTLRGVR